MSANSAPTKKAFPARSTTASSSDAPVLIGPAPRVAASAGVAEAGEQEPVGSVCRQPGDGEPDPRRERQAVLVGPGNVADVEFDGVADGGCRSSHSATSPPSVSDSMPSGAPGR